MTDCAGLRGAREIAEEKTASLTRLSRKPMSGLSPERIAAERALNDIIVIGEVLDEAKYEALAARLAEVEAERDGIRSLFFQAKSWALAAESRLSASADPVCDDPSITTTPVSESREQRMLEPVQGPFVEDDMPPPAALTAGETGGLVERLEKLYRDINNGCAEPYFDADAAHEAALALRAAALSAGGK